MTKTLCRCGKPTVSTVICKSCTKTMTRALENVADYCADLETLRTKQTRYGSGSGGRTIGKSMPLGFDARFDRDGAGTVAEKLARQVLASWAAKVARERRPVAGPVCAGPCLHRTCAEIEKRRARPRPTVPGCVEYLTSHVKHIVARDYAPELLDLLLDVEKRLRKLIDRPADLWYAGRCGSETDMLDEHDQVVDVAVCDRELYARLGAVSVRCPVCGCEYDVAARRDTLLDEAEDRQATVESIVRIVTTLGDVKVSSAKISARVRTWAQRGKLTAHGTRVVDGRERPTYRVGDVLDLLANSEGKTARV